MLIVPALLFLLVLLNATNGDGQIRHTLDHNMQILADFKAAEQFADDFRRTHNRLPDQDEMLAWSNTRRLRAGQIFVVDAQKFANAEEEFASLGQPPPGGYILGMWRGEWMEYYASWSHRGTMPLDQSAYYITGNRTFDIVLSLFAIILCIWAAMKLSLTSSRNWTN